MARCDYSACNYKSRSPAASTVDAAFLETIKKEARVLPLYEERIHKYKYTKGYSLIYNEMLKCRWAEFVNVNKPTVPFFFPSAKDLHFINGSVLLEPKETVNNRENHRFHLRVGPGIDKFGEVLGLPPSANEGVLPLFEAKVSNYKRQKLCSLQTNELLKCRWKGYVKNIEGMKRIPFEFPNICDLHFYNNDVRYMPSESPKVWDRRMRLKPGPGIDQFGEMPIPNDMHVSKNSKPAARPKPIRYSRNKNLKR